MDEAPSVYTFVSFSISHGRSENYARLNQWSHTLEQRDIIPDPELENWSGGRGQHAEYQCQERDINPLEFEFLLAEGATARVESVRCMRVRLVKKTIRCNRRTRIKREDALQEVQQLYRAQHSHIVRLVGTYVLEDELAILTYPCAEWSLEQFLLTTPTATDTTDRSLALSRFFTCLANVLDFMHSFPIKHMDIKPQNILVRDIRHSQINHTDMFKIYVTDFGSSKFYPSVEDSETDNWTPFSRAYAAQEVVLQEKRGLSADVFSMGCVYVEMITTVLDVSATRKRCGSTHRDALLCSRSDSDGKVRPYHLKVSEVCTWLASLPVIPEGLPAVHSLLFQMLSKEPSQRPTARAIAKHPGLPLACYSCILRTGPESFEAAPSSTPVSI